MTNRNKSIESTPDDRPKAGLDILAIELKRARDAKGLSHSELNRLTGISRAVLYGYEVGRTKPGAREIKLLCEALEITPNRLIFGADEPFKPSGLSLLMKYKGNSAIARLVFVLYFNYVLDALDKAQVEALLTLFISLVEARDKELFKRLTVAIEVIAEKIESTLPESLTLEQCTQEQLSDFMGLFGDPEFISTFEHEVERRISKLN